MPFPISRRSALCAAATGAMATAASAAFAREAAPLSPRKSVMFTMLPQALSLQDRFRLARRVGFDGVEAPPVDDEAQAEAMRSAAESAGIPIQSVIYGGWEAPLSSADTSVVAAGLRSAAAALRSAKWMGARDILLVPAIVDEQTRYIEAWTRSQKHVRSLIPLAEELDIMICIEEVWNDFLLSPLEFAHYIDSFHHPLIRAYFDVGNVLAFGYPQDWIRTLGKRIHNVHLKDYRRSTHQFVNLRDGDVNWPEVRKAFAEVGFHGYMNTELPAGDEAYLRDVSQRVDLILAGR
ncbi:MAG TPA: sugar phosphate isomerase/epimerase family protein [Chthonomonadales bacterium]|nr:sugar phosphate isomerase/epimerase family protein [Chthonomonadales bacterium]